MEPKARLTIAWLFIAIVFLALIAGILFQNNGLAIEIQPLENREEFAVIVKNQSQHEIRNISVKQISGEEKELKTIALLAPQSEETLFIPSQNSRITIQTSAPFHQSVEKSLFVQSPKAFPTTITLPENLQLDQAFEAILEVCNQTNQTELRVSEEHDPSFFGIQQHEQRLSLPKGNCETMRFSFTPRFSGATIVVFKIQNSTDSETVQKELVIRSG